MKERTVNQLPLFQYALANTPKVIHHSTGPFSKKYEQPINALFAQLASGQPLSEACKLSGISRRTLYNWVRSHPRFAKSLSVYRQVKPLPHHEQNPRKGYKGPHDPKCQPKVEALIEALRKGQTMRRACKIAGLSDTLVYRWKREDEAFSSQIDSAHCYDSSGNIKESNEEAHNHGRVELGLLNPNHLYIIRAEGCDLVKVGTSRKPSKRLKGLQTGSPLKLTLHCYFVGAAYLEGEIHKSLTLKGLYSHGEWFHKSCISLVRKHIEGHIRDLSNHLQQKIVSPHPRQDHHISGAGENHQEQS